MEDHVLGAIMVDRAIKRAGGVIFVGIGGVLWVYPKRIMTPQLAASVKRYAVTLRTLLSQI